jgi:hypothetical protein
MTLAPVRCILLPLRVRLEYLAEVPDSFIYCFVAELTPSISALCHCCAIKAAVVDLLFAPLAAPRRQTATRTKPRVAFYA